MDDPDAVPVSVLDLVVRKEYEEEITLYEMLKRQLPSPDVFTPCTYRSKHHTVDQVEKASACLNVTPHEYALKARALQYNENRGILKEALSESVQRSASPSIYSVGAGVMMPSGAESQHMERKTPCETRSGEDVQLNLVAQWELKRDIERLEALQRNISEARSRITQYPLLSNYSIRESKVQRMPRPERPATPWMDAELNSPLMATMIRSGTHVERARSSDWAREHPWNISNSSFTSQRSSSIQSLLPDNRPPHIPGRRSLSPSRIQSFFFLNMHSGLSVASPRLSRVDSGDASTVRCAATTSHPSSMRSRPATAGKERDRIAAENIVRSLGPVSKRAPSSMTSSTAAAVANELIRNEEREEQARLREVISEWSAI